MKGTLAILGLLVAAYAAPLFGNEVPLILEEAIQMPLASSIWDVAPTWDGTYHWCMLPSDFDSILVLRWGTNASNEVDSILLDELSPSERNLRAGAAALYYAAEGDVCVALALTGESIPPPIPTVRLHCLELCLSCDDSVLPFVWPFTYSGYSDTWGTGWRRIERLDITGAYFLSIGTPPDSYSELRLNVRKRRSVTYYSDGNDRHTTSDEGKLMSRLAGDSAGVFLETSGGNIDQTLWANSNFLVKSATINTDGVVANRLSGYEFDGQSSTVVFDSTLSPDGGHTVAQVCAIHDLERQALTTCCLNNLGEITAVAGSEVDTLWQVSGPYSMLITAYVLLGDHTEHILARRPDGRFDIIRVGEGDIWGQTSPLDSGYAQIKIIGRYHNETRRLVVRYGSELRIYRFGEPIYTDADDTRPELPQELALSAYPNPFNPTTLIAFDLPRAARASLSVYDLNGRLVQTLFDEPRTAGHGEIAFNGANLPSGIYFARFVAGDFARTQKLVLLK